jgi:hypothetical protein
MILRINIGFKDARSRPRMIRRRAPNVFDQLHPAQFFQRNTTPVCLRTQRIEPAPTLAAILVTECTKLPFPIPAQSVRAK